MAETQHFFSWLVKGSAAYVRWQISVLLGMINGGNTRLLLAGTDGLINGGDTALFLLAGQQFD
jgi:hypothetical protein